MSESIKGFCLHGREKILPNSGVKVTSNTSVVDMEIPELKEGEIRGQDIIYGYLWF